MQAPIASLLNLTLVTTIARGMAGGLLGLAVLGWVVGRGGSGGTEVVVHVMARDVEVTVGDQTYQVEGRRDNPLVCELPAGWHPLIMRRGDRVLFEEWFEVQPGWNVVRGVWDWDRVRFEHRPRSGRDSPWPVHQDPGQIEVTGRPRGGVNAAATPPSTGN